MQMTPAAEPQMSREDFLMIRDFIHEKCGIYFAENKTYLVKNRLVKRMAELGIKNFRDYFYHVKYDTSLKEFTALLNLITTNETSFFRNEPQLLSFSNEVLPLLVEQKGKIRSKQLRIWSAGCSTGEEPYTLSMIIHEKLKDLKDWSVEIIANDISEQVLQAARRGEYSGITLRNVSPEALNRFFTKSGDVYRVNPSVKSLVNFSHMNLNDPRRTSINSNVDVIFCRNVMIYFSDDVKRQLTRNFYNALAPGGYFYIGHSETLHGISKAFKLVYFKNALVYHREVTGPAGSAGATSTIGSYRSGSSIGTAAGGVSTGAARALDLLAKIKPADTVK